MDFELLLGPIAFSFLTSFITVMLGYFRDTDPDKEFEAGKFLATVIIAVIISILTSLLGWDYSTAKVWLAQAGLTVWVYWLVNIVAKQFLHVQS
jgi:hypothetical protein